MINSLEPPRLALFLGRSFSAKLSKMKILHIIILSLLTLSTAGAETVYKSVDAQGKVTYSSTPPPPGNAEAIEEVPIAPPPPESQRKQAEEQMRQLEIDIARGEREREERRKKTADSTADAENELQKAQVELEEAKIQSDDDWQYLATGGRVLRQSYLDRVSKAEQRVKAAEQSLHGARSGRP